MLDKEDGIFCGLESIVNSYLLDPTWQRKVGTPSFAHDKNCLLLNKDSTPNFFKDKAEEMILEMLIRIESNILTRRALDLKEKNKSALSKFNWNFSYRDKKDPRTGEENDSPEVTLERAIIQARRKLNNPMHKDKWAYQMPVATGLFGSNTDKSSNIDLVRMYPDGAFEMIELKVGSNNPLYAAIEILLYGLAYAASRKLAVEIGYKIEELEILKAQQIHLRVLAPRSFYDSRYNLAWLENDLNKVLGQFSSKHGYHMTFGFYLLNYDWKPTSRPKEKDLDEINEAVNNISPVTWGNTATP